MKVPNTCQFTEEHLWVEATDDNLWLVGITEYAQDLLGDLVFIEAPAIGSLISQGQSCGIVESVKTGADLFAPLTGKVVAINAEVINDPERIQYHAYSAWIFKMQTTAESLTSHLLSAVDYQALINQK